MSRSNPWSKLFLVMAAIALLLLALFTDLGFSNAQSSGNLLTNGNFERGFTYREVADILNISAQTVPVHVRNIYRKLDAGNRSEAVYEATRQGLIEI